MWVSALAHPACMSLPEDPGVSTHIFSSNSNAAELEHPARSSAESCRTNFA
jgi:hypothetical protein